MTSESADGNRQITNCLRNLKTCDHLLRWTTRYLMFGWLIPAVPVVIFAQEKIPLFFASYLIVAVAGFFWRDYDHETTAYDTETARLKRKTCRWRTTTKNKLGWLQKENRMFSSAESQTLHFTKPVEDGLRGPMLAAMVVVSIALIASILTGNAPEVRRSGLACLLTIVAITSIAECSAMVLAGPRTVHGRLLTISNGIIGTFILSLAIAANVGSVEFTSHWLETGLIAAGIAVIYKMGSQILSTMRTL